MDYPLARQSAFAITIPLFQFIFERPVFSVMGKVSWEFLEVTLKLLSCMFSELFSGSWDHSLRDVTTSTVRHVSFFIWPAYTFILWRLQIWASRGPEFNPNLRAPLPTHPWTMSQAKLRPLFFSFGFQSRLFRNLDGTTMPFSLSMEAKLYAIHCLSLASLPASLFPSLWLPSHLILEYLCLA